MAPVFLFLGGISVKFITKTAEQMTPVEYKACYLANYGRGGYMQDILWEARNEGSEALVIMLWDGEPTKVSSLIGWAILTPVTEHGPIGVTKYVMQRSKYTAQFWVKRQHRRKGFGKMLLAEAHKHDNNPHVMPHSEASGELFSTSQVQVMKTDKRWMVKKPLMV